MADTQVARGAGRPKSLKKRQQILDSAADLMLSLGYKNTSMDAVAKESGVSKQTVYSHFSNKDALFNAIIEGKCEMYQVDEQNLSIQSQSLQDMLTEIGYRFIQLLNDENVISMYKVVIGESGHDTKVAELFYQAGPQHSIDMVTKLLTQHPDSNMGGVLASETSIDFFNLLKSDYHMRGILHLAYSMTDAEQYDLAVKVARKTLALIALIQNNNA